MSHAYPILFALGTLAGLAWLLFVDPPRPMRGSGKDAGPAATRRVDAGLAALVFGLVGARVSYVAGHTSYFATHLNEAVRFSAGGLSWVGGALGALVGVGVMALLRRTSPWSMADALAIPATLLATAAWSGCLVDGCAFGRPLAPSLLSSLAPDFYFSRIARWPAQLLGLLAACGLLLGLLLLEPRALRPGLLASVVLIGLGLSALALSFARGDPVPLWSGIRLDALGAMVVVALGAGGALFCRRAAPP